MFVGNDADTRPQHFLAGMELADRYAGPPQRAVGGQHELTVGRLYQARSTRGDLAGQGLLGSILQRLRLRAARRRIRQENESVEPADQMTFDDHIAGFVEIRLKYRVFTKPPHQHASAAIDEALGK